MMLEKPAQADYPVHDLIKRRWSPVSFLEKPVEFEKIKSLFEAARWAPSSFNEQPWYFLIASKKNKSDYQKMLECLMDHNQLWASSAPVLLIAVASLKFTRNDHLNRHAYHDVGLALQNMILQAVSEGLMARMIAGFHIEKVTKAYQIPDQYEPVTAVALGYPNPSEDLDQKLLAKQKAPRLRKPVQDFVYEGAWGSPAQFLKS